MNREIKFRAWDKVNKEWLEYRKHPVGWLHGVGTSIDGSGPVLHEMHVFVSPNGAAFSELQYCLDNPEHFAVMQYAGLKDVDGKEVYEADIVQQVDNDVTGPPRVIGFWDGWFNLMPIDWDFKTFPKSTGFINHHIKVIGNIYETPELLVNS